MPVSERHSKLVYDALVAAGVRAATVGLWNVVNDLGLEHEQLIDLGA
jgi:hypothetical protein